MMKQHFADYRVNQAPQLRPQNMPLADISPTMIVLRRGSVQIVVTH
jgi:hypothetical protein